MRVNDIWNDSTLDFSNVHDAYCAGYDDGYGDGLAELESRLEAAMAVLLSNHAGVTGDADAIEQVGEALGFHPDRGRNG